MKIKCEACKTVTLVNRVGGYGIPYGDPKHYTPGHDLVYSLYKCSNCNHPILVSVQGLGYEDLNAEHLKTAKPVILYPLPVFHINPAIPEILRKALSEAIKTHQADVHTAAAIMCRRTLDGFCAENGATKRSLAANLEELRDNGTITDQLFEWATALRLSGNEAAHDVTVTFSAEDARDLLDFTVAILDFTYSFRVKFEAFRNRRENKKSEEK